ncbi:hypothetical protein LCGC14_1674170 [marine sediment metagenome]|uniref:Uncharacterized protein n=1 Tax=marine sediment metagenome TaxID=412755 RepID=A0A0F9HR93_9ZZZZ
MANQSDLLRAIRFGAQVIAQAMNTVKASVVSSSPTSTTKPATDDKATIVSDVRNEEILVALNSQIEVLERVNKQLEFITGIELNPGDN